MVAGGTHSATAGYGYFGYERKNCSIYGDPAGWYKLSTMTDDFH